MILGFGNNVVSSLASDITASQTTFSVIPGDGQLFAALLTSDFSNKSTALKNYAKITLTDSGETAFEVCHLTAVNGDTLTVIRGQEGTAAKGWSLKDVVANFATRGSENAFPQIAHIQSGFYTSGTAGGTANALTLELPTAFFLNGSADWVLKTPIVVYPIQNNTGAATLQLTMGGRVLGTFPLYKGNKDALVPNDILKDVALVCLMDNTKSFFTILNPGGIYSSFVPITRKVNGHALDKDTNVTSQDIFNGQAIGLSTEDLDTLKTPGIYYQPANANTSAARHYPETNAGTLLVYKNAGVTQVYLVYNSSRTYTRSQYSTGAWTAWAKQYDTANKPTAADVGALPITGGTLNGNLTVQNTIQIGSIGKAILNIGDNDSGLRSSKDGQVDLWANGKMFGYWNTATFAFTGQIIPTNYTNFDGRYQAKGNYTPAGQAFTKSESDARYQKGNTASRAASGWYKDTNTGIIFQWGTVNRTNFSTPVTFPIAFPSVCVGVSATLRNYINDISSSTFNIRAVNVSRTGFQYGSGGTSESQAFWFAIGY